MNSIKKYYKALTRYQKYALATFVLIALFHKIISNDKYLVAKTNNGIKFMQDERPGVKGIKTIIPYSPNGLDKNNRKVSPFGKQNVGSLYYRHWLGTDPLGRDVLSGLVHGTFVAFKVGFLTVLLSLLLGIPLGFLSGYYGNDGLRIKKAHAIVLIPIVALFWFYAIYSNGFYATIFFLLPFVLLWFLVERQRPNVLNTYSLPADSIIFRTVEIIGSIPNLFLILMLLSILGEASIWKVVLIISLLRWPIIVRHLRAEILKIREEDFVIAAKVINQTDWKIFMHHILPLAASPLLIVSAFGFSTAILLESTLSFLGIGVPIDQITWGSLIKDARLNFDAWWLAIFPGLMIYWVIQLFNSIGDSISTQMKKA